MTMTEEVLGKGVSMVDISSDLLHHRDPRTARRFYVDVQVPKLMPTMISESWGEGRADVPDLLRRWDGSSRPCSFTAVQWWNHRGLLHWQRRQGREPGDLGGGNLGASADLDGADASGADLDLQGGQANAEAVRGFGVGIGISGGE